MEDKNRISNLGRLRNSLEALERSLISTAHSLDDVAISLENAHLASPNPDVLNIQEKAQFLIDRFRRPS